MGSVYTNYAMHAGHRSTWLTVILVSRGKMFNIRRVICYRVKNIHEFLVENILFW